MLIPQLDCWGNCTYGDCVSAEECFAKASYSITQGAPELFIPAATIVAWASSHGFLYGANLTDVMDAMASDGIVVNGVTYKDGPKQSVDFSNYATLCSAIYVGPVKLGIAADQLETAVNSTNDQSGWWLTGASSDQDEDHSIPALGYGTAQQLAALLGVPVKSGLDPSTSCVLLGTWGTEGIAEFKSLVNITGEAWLRTPTTIPAPVPVPTPTPTPTPTPVPPTPTPTPPPVTAISLPDGNYTVSVINGVTTFTPVPIGQTITFPDGTSIQVLETPASQVKPTPQFFQTKKAG